MGTWSPTAWLLLLVAMFFGGAAGSTVGGVKLNRVILLFKGIQWLFKSMSLRPHQLMRYTLGEEVLTQDDANRRVDNAAVLVALWVITLFFGIVAMLHVVAPGYGIPAIAFEVASALSNVGLSQGITGPDMEWPAKLVLILCMWVGRLEIIPVTLIIARLVGRD
jgi:trk system potassium uptake protein TrkH